MNVTKLKIVDNSLTSPVVAYLYTGETEWRDPHGGSFSHGEQCQLTSVALGQAEQVRMHAGTKFEAVLDVRLVVEVK